LRNRPVGWRLREAFFLELIREIPKRAEIRRQTGNAHTPAELPPV
jgi:hypothetical protein